MNKTAYKPPQIRKRQVVTQTNFRKPHSPIRSQKSFDSSSLRTQMLINKQYAITSTNWCLFDMNCNTFLGVREEQQREVASLTKIMTTIISIQLFQRYRMEKEILIRISCSAAGQSGTTAELKTGKYIKLYDLFYGTMLPSGNDAAFLLAEVFGLLLFYQSVKPQSKDYSEIESIDLTCYESTSTFLTRFLKQMNKKAKQLMMPKTIFTNPHGLANILNVSCAKDILTLSKYCYANKIFRSVMNCGLYSPTLYEDDMEKVHSVIKWTNTNKLLSMGWQGIKTGQTIPAGCCLASVREGIFIIVLNSSSRQTRFEDTMMIWQWYHTSGQNSKQ